MAGEIRASFKLALEGNYAVLQVEGIKHIENKTRPQKLLEKQLRIPAPEYKSLTVAEFKRKLGGKFIQTLPGGVFLGTLDKKPLNDLDKLSEVGIKAEPFLKSYEISFQYDPDIDPASGYLVSPREPVISPRNLVVEPKNDTTHHENTDNFDISISVSVTGHIPNQNCVLELNGQSKLYQASQKIEFKLKEFEEMRLQDILKQLDNTWPQFQRSGIFIKTPKGKEPTSKSNKLINMGMKPSPGETNTYVIELDIDPAAPAPKVSLKSPREPSVVPPLNTKKQSPRPAVSLSSSQPFSPREDQLILDLSVFNEGEKNLVSLTGTNKSSTYKKELYFNSSDFNALKIDELLAQLGSSWPTLKWGGYLISDQGKKAFLGDDKLSDMGIIQESGRIKKFKLLFDIDTASTKKTLASSKEAAKSQVSPRGGPSGIIRVRARLFLDNNSYILVLSGTSGSFSVESDLSIPAKEFENLTVGNFKSKFGSKWPNLLPGGTFLILDKQENLKDSDQLSKAGWKGSSSPVTYDCSFMINTGEAISSSSNQLKMDIKLLQDAGYYFVTVTIESKNFNVSREFTSRDSDLMLMRVSEFLDKLKPLPKLENGYYVEGGKAIALDSTMRRLLSSDASRIANHHFTFDQVGPAPAETTQSKEGMSSRTVATSKVLPPLSVAQDEIGVNLRVYYSDGAFFITAQGKSKDFEKSTEITLSSRELSSLTFANLKSQLSSWPQTLDGGVFLSESGSVNFTDNDYLEKVGIKGSRADVNAYQVIFKLKPTIIAKIITRPSARTLGLVKPIQATIRIFVDDNGSHNISIDGKSDRWRQSSEFSVSKDVFKHMTWGDIKQKLSAKWPQTKDGNKVASSNFSDSTTLESSGVTSDPDRVKSYDVFWEV